MYSLIALRSKGSIACVTLALASAALMTLACLDLILEGLASAQHSAHLRNLVLEVRAPRVLGAWSAGACLGLAGALAQSLFRNPLADPYLTGTASGANLGVALSLVVLGSVRIEFAFLGALFAVALTLSLARGRGSDGLLLAGFVLSILLSAVVALLLLRFPEHLRSNQLFMLGQTQLLDWQASLVMLPAVLACLLASFYFTQPLQALALGEASAMNLGLAVHQLRWMVIAVIALLSAVSVSYCGMLAFVGLGAPHIARSIYRPLMLRQPGSQWLLSSLIGALLLLASDTLARWLLWPIELPVGIVTALVGGVYLLVLLRGSDQHGQR